MDEKIDKPWGLKLSGHKQMIMLESYAHKRRHRLSKQYHVNKKTVYVLEGVLYNYDENDIPQRIYPESRFMCVQVKSTALEPLRATFE